MVFVQWILKRNEGKARESMTPEFLLSISHLEHAFAITGIHPSRSGKYVDTTYPQCTAAAAHSTPQWIPRWPSRCHRAALWQLCVESSPLAPKKKKEMTNETGSSSFKNRPPPLFCFKFSLLLLWIFLTP